MKRTFITLAILTSVLTGFAQETIELKNWKFSTGDNLEWAISDFNDSAWNTIQSGLTCHQQGYEYLEGYAWYRIKFALPSGIKQTGLFKDSVQFTLGKINKCDQTFLNGKLLGQNAVLCKDKACLVTTETVPDLTQTPSAQDAVRNYTLSVNDPRLLWDRENTLAIRVYVGGFLAGMWDGPTGVSMKDVKDYIVFDIDSTPMERMHDGTASKTISLKNLSPLPEIKGKLIAEISDDKTNQLIKKQVFDVSLKRDDAAFKIDFRTGFSNLVKATYTFVDAGSKSKAEREQILSCIKLTSSDRRLQTAFAWAQKTAIGYARWNDPVGKCYEAVLPGFNGFYLRDVAHHTTGAYYLGLGEYNKNMLAQFAENQSPQHGWITSIHIPYQGVPANYKEICDTWNPLFEIPFSLPCNFEGTWACYRMFELTGDASYILQDPFYSYHYHNVHEFVKAWDSDHDGIMDSRACDILVDPTIAEYSKQHTFTAVDMLATQAKGYAVFADIMKIKNEADSAKHFTGLAEHIRNEYEQNWWDSQANSLYSLKTDDGKFNDASAGRGTLAWMEASALYYDLAKDKARIETMLADLEKGYGCEECVEGNSYQPLVFYKYDHNDVAYNRMLAIVDPLVKRRTYPEVPFSFIGTCIEGLMGIELHAPENAIITTPKLPSDTCLVEISFIPYKTGYINVKHSGLHSTQITNNSTRALMWRAILPGNQKELWVDNKKFAAKQTSNFRGEPMSYVEIMVYSMSSCVVSKSPQ